MSAESGTRSAAYSRTLSQAIELMHKSRWEFNRERIQQGEPTNGTHGRFEQAVLNVYEELFPYKEHQKAREVWEENTLDYLPAICGQVRQDHDVRTSGGKLRVHTSDMVSHVPGDQLLKMSRALDEVGRELGLTVETSQPTPNDEGSYEDLRHLLEARGQTEAAERLAGEPDEGGDADET